MKNAEDKVTTSKVKRGAQGAPTKQPAKKGATPKKNAKAGAQGPKPGNVKAPGKKTKQVKAPKETGKTREGSKKAQVLALLQRAEGATLPQLMETTGWQAHSVRGFLSTLAKKLDVTIATSQAESGERVYAL